MTNSTDTPSVEQLHTALVEEVTRPDTAVRAAFAAVPRHLFLPHLDPAEAYNNANINTHYRDGEAISSASQPDVVAMMLTQLDVHPGMSVLEIGAGTGFNAALIDELVGPDGKVVTVDIEPDVTAAARQHLDATGHDRVEVITGDGADGAPGHGPFDRIIATAGVWDIPPAWWEQLAENGRIVVPLRWRGLTRSVAFDRDGDRMVSADSRLCGFIPLQGQEGERRLVLEQGVQVFYDQDADIDAAALEGVLSTPRSDAWSGRIITGETPFSGLWMRMAAGVPGTGRMVPSAEGVESRLITPALRWLLPAVVRCGSLAYVQIRKVADGQFELGAVGHGPEGKALASEVAAVAAAWDPAEGEPTIALARGLDGSETADVVKDNATLTIQFT
ncbi:methyltransferase, FxLD system [Nocardiopsis coralliicola]